MAEAVEDAFKYSHLVLAAASYDAGIFPPMKDFIHHLQDKSFQNRRVALIENGSWAPVAGKLMHAEMARLKDIDIVEPIVTIKGKMKASDEIKLKELADSLLSIED
jgi:flavorubredoxin